MFTIDKDGKVTPYPKTAECVDQTDSNQPFWTQDQLRDIIDEAPGVFAVKTWNQLPGVTPIHTSPGEPTAKFRNKQTAVERIWAKLCELYPDAVNSEDMPKKQKVRGSRGDSGTAKLRRRRAETGRGPRPAKNGRKSAWAAELTEALRKQFNPGDSFELQDVYKLIPQFQRRHKENHHVAARLRTTLAQDLRGAGIVKTTGKGKYRLVA